MSVWRVIALAVLVLAEAACAGPEGAGAAGPAPADHDPGPPERWYVVESPTRSNLLAISFSPDGAGFAVGEDGTVLRYESGTFRPIPGPGEPVTFHLMATIGPDELWAVAEGIGELHHYARGRWTKLRLPENVIMAMGFLGPRLGYAGGLFGVLYRYDGERWEPVRTSALTHDRESHLTGIALLAPDDVWIGSEMGFVLHFDGRDWRRLHPRPKAHGARLQRLGDTVALLDAPALRLEDGAFRPLGDQGSIQLAEHRDSIWGVTADGRLHRIGANGGPSLRPPRAARSIAAGPDGLWAVGDGGLLLHLEPAVLPAFEDQTFAAGVGVVSESDTALLTDLDGSGHPDLVLAPFGRQSFLRAETALELRAAQLTLPAASALPLAQSIAAADMDGDGGVDLLVRPPGHEGAAPWHLLRNLGELRFVPAGPDVPPLASEDVSLAGDLEVADFDGDGDLDVYEVRWLAEQPTGLPVPNVLYRNDGLGRLTPRALAHYDGGASLSWSAAALAADLDGDGRTDLLSVNAWGDGNAFFRQTADGRLVDATGSSGLAGAFQQGVDAVAGDVDGDGAYDVLVLASTPYGPSRLYRNDGRGHFRDVTNASGLAGVVGTAKRAVLADMDLDGDLDLLVCGAQPPEAVSRSSPPPSVRFLLNDGRGRFTDVTFKTGIDLDATDAQVHDFDGDGDLDVHLVRPGEGNRLFSNLTSGNGWLRVEPRAPPPNRAAIGARVAIYDAAGALLGVRQTSAREPIAHFGLGREQRVTVEVRFPGGRVQVREGVERGQTLHVAERPWPVMAAAHAAFFVRHRLAWMDGRRQGLKLLAALAFVALLVRGGPRLGARRLVTRPRVAAGLLCTYAGLELAWMPLVELSWVADALPLTVLLGLGLALGIADRVRTRQRDARFVGQYELLSVLGQGGMGIVYRARDGAAPGRPVVALKVLRPERVADPVSRRRFVREADVGATLDHPGIVRVLGSGECRIREGRGWQTTAYLAMEWIEGVPLSSLLSGGESLPLARAIEIVRDAAEALGAAHAAGILHRDVKPDNVLLTRGGAVKLVDFGIAALARSSEATDAGMLVGTLAYMPPERVAGRAEDARGDLYALGVMLYEAACGQRPFGDQEVPAALLRAIVSDTPVPPHAWRPELPPRLSALIMSLLAKEPARRPGSASALVDALDEVLRELRGEARAHSWGIGPASATSVDPPSSAPQPADERVTLDLPPPR